MAAPIIQSRQIEKFKTRQACQCREVGRHDDGVGRVGPGSDGRPRIETQELSPSLSVVIQAVSLYLGHRFDAGAPLSSDHTVL